MAGALCLLLCAGWSAQPVPTPPDLTNADPMVVELLRERISSVESGGTAVDWMALAEAYDANAYLVEAVACYREALRRREDARAWYLLGLVLNDLGALDEAIEALERASSLDPTYAPSLWRRGFWLLDDGRVDEAAELFERAKGTEAGRFGLARVAIARRDAALARERLAPLLGPGRNQTYAQQLMAIVHRMEGDTEAARDAMAIGAGAGPVWTDPWLRDVLRQETGYDATMDEIARLTGAGRHAEAIVVIEAMLETRPDDLALRNYLGYAQYGLGRREQAIRTWEAALALDPDQYLLLLNLATLFAEDALQGRRPVEMPIDLLRRSIEANPAHARTHEVLGSLLNALGRTEEAVGPLEEAFALDPANPHLARQLGALDMSRSAWADAERVLRRLVLLRPDDPEAWLRLAVSRMEMGLYDQAEAALERGSALLEAGHPTVGTIRTDIDRRRREADR